MAVRPVKLKPDKPAPGPAIRLRRSDDGFSFSVEHVDSRGTADFRTEAMFSGYDAALKEAQSRAQHHRLPIQNQTGVDEPEPVEKAQPARPTSKASASSPRRASQAKELPLVEAQFNLPNVDDRLAAVDMKSLVERAFAIFAQERDDYLDQHAETYGDSRGHTVTFSQKTYDQIQGQIRALYLQMLTVQAINYARFEKAFDLIEQAVVDRLSYEGVYQSGRTYSKGSVVTWGGSCWHCNKETDTKPGDSEDRETWTLMVKRGRDGKDLRDVAK